MLVSNGVTNFVSDVEGREIAFPLPGVPPTDPHLLMSPGPHWVHCEFPGEPSLTPLPLTTQISQAVKVARANVCPLDFCH